MIVGSDCVATHILAFDGDSQIVWAEGNYQDYEAQREERLGLPQNNRDWIHYKKLTH